MNDKTDWMKPTLSPSLERQQIGRATRRTERKPVDVLAVMDAHAASCESAAIRNSSADNLAAHEAATEARAAVAELIAAGDNLLAKMSGGRDWSGHSDEFLARERFVAAIANVGGAA